MTGLVNIGMNAKSAIPTEVHPNSEQGHVGKPNIGYNGNLSPDQVKGLSNYNNYAEIPAKVAVSGKTPEPKVGNKDAVQPHMDFKQQEPEVKEVMVTNLQVLEHKIEAKKTRIKCSFKTNAKDAPVFMYLYDTFSNRLLNGSSKSTSSQGLVDETFDGVFHHGQNLLVQLMFNKFSATQSYHITVS